MKPKAFVKEIELHDSGIERIIYDEGATTLNIKIELCNWMQSWFKDGNPEIVSGILLFSGIKEIDLDSEIFSWFEDTNNFVEIEKIEIVTDHDFNEELVRLHIAFRKPYDESSAYSSVPSIITIRCADISWQPDGNNR